MLPRMAPRKPLAILVAALALCAWTACKGKDDAAKPAGDFDQRCEQLAKACSDDKHAPKLGDECKDKKPADACTAKLTALYDCYEKELCGKADKVWALGDLRVLAERKNVCAAERTAAGDCGK